MTEGVIGSDPVDLAKGVDRAGRPFRIRPLASGDRQKLQHFYEAFEPKRSAQGLPPAESERIEAWLEAILARGIHLIVISADEVVGHGFVTPTPTPGIGEYAVFVQQDRRGNGMGTELSRAVVDTARNAGLRGLWLSVEPENRAAIRAYEKVGFEFVGSTRYSVEPEMELRL
jgi:RimJ/RimL family protein N-acetyltransferase